MKYFSTTEAAVNWGISANRISILAKEGRIPGAVQVGMRWLIPANAEKPTDGRTKKTKASKGDALFRFPLFVNFEEKDYSPSLSDEELTLRHGQKAFQACCFKEAKALLTSLDHAKSRYVRLSSYYHLLYIAIFDNHSDFDDIFWKMNSELSQDFPYKNEMLILRYGFDVDIISYKSVLEEFNINSEYTYHPSAYSILALLSFIPIQNGDLSLMSKLRYDTQELLCQQMEHEGYHLEAQKMHYLLSVIYHLQGDSEKMKGHIRHGLQLAMDHDLYFVPAFYERWYRNPTHKVLHEFPEDFSKKIRSLGSTIQKKQARFEESRNNSSYLSSLSGKDFEYAFLANQGYTNREIAQKLKVSEKTVSKVYRELYEQFGVKSKHEFVDMINHTHKNRKSDTMK